ncbi:MAG: hypothetical protein QXP52_01760 [Candidatus Aenigmatarchaeota archaeon]
MKERELTLNFVEFLFGDVYREIDIECQRICNNIFRFIERNGSKKSAKYLLEDLSFNNRISFLRSIYDIIEQSKLYEIGLISGYKEYLRILEEIGSRVEEERRMLKKYDKERLIKEILKIAYKVQIITDCIAVNFKNFMDYIAFFASEDYYSNFNSFKQKKLREIEKAIDNLKSNKGKFSKYDYRTLSQLIIDSFGINNLENSLYYNIIILPPEEIFTNSWPTQENEMRKFLDSGKIDEIIERKVNVYRIFSTARQINIKSEFLPMIEKYVKKIKTDFSEINIDVV